MATYLEDVFTCRTFASVAEIKAAVVEAGLRRIRPCLMTTMTTIIGLIPVFLTEGRGSDVMQRAVHCAVLVLCRRRVEVHVGTTASGTRRRVTRIHRFQLAVSFHAELPDTTQGLEIDLHLRYHLVRLGS